MLLGHNDEYTADKVMKVTVAFNHFGPGLIERMPRWVELALKSHDINGIKSNKNILEY